MSKPIDYEKKQYDYSFANKKKHLSNVRSMKPNATNPQQKYLNYLIQLCLDNGIEPYGRIPIDPKQIFDARRLYGRCIYENKKRLSAKGINYENPFNKYKFDKDGNVVNAKTGKIVTRRN